MDISLIIVSYNTKDYLLGCLRSVIRAQGTHDLEIIVVDNGSSDGSLALLTTHFPQVKVIENRENVGFGTANNQAAAIATKSNLFFLNSDTVLSDGFFDQLTQAMENRDIKLATVKLLNPDHSIQPQGGHLPNLGNMFAWMFFIDDLPLIGWLIPAYQQRRLSYFKKDRHLGWIGGTAMLVKRDTFQSLGGFDQHIFMYGEDVEFCYRARTLGIKPQYFSKPSLTHYGQGSSTAANSITGEFKGLIYLFTKHKPAWQLPILKWYLKIGAGLRIVLFGIIGKNETKRTAYKKAIEVVG
jgi:N-acetylglucosaminyl-diphospho-decaprenol L-rhamnosyltransferase